MLKERKEKKIESSVISDIMRKYEFHYPAEPAEIGQLLAIVKNSVPEATYRNIRTSILYEIVKETS